MDINTVNEEMSLAEALQLRADIKTQIAQLHSRLNDNAKVQEGEAPADAVGGQGENFPGLQVAVSEAAGTKCPRCWKHSTKADENGLCPRCAAVVAKLPDLA